MISKKYLIVKLIFALLFVTLVHSVKNSDEYNNGNNQNKPEIARQGKTKKALMGKYLNKYSRVCLLLLSLNNVYYINPRWCVGTLCYLDILKPLRKKLMKSLHIVRPCYFHKDG